GTDFQNLRHQRRIVRDPIPHHNPAAWPGHAHQLPGDVERPGREHRAEDTDDEVEGIVRELAQVGRITLLEPAVRQIRRLRASAAGLDKVSRDIDAEYVGAQSGRGQRGRAVAASQVQHLRSCCDADAGHDSLSALAHSRRDPGEVALLPQCLIRIWIHELSLLVWTRKVQCDYRVYHARTSPSLARTA